MSMLTVGIIGGGLKIASGIFGASSAKKRKRAAAREKRRLQNKLNQLEKSRQAIVNPYSGAENLSNLASDLSGNISNPFANLGVATQAAEMQIEESDISLANTLDTIRATGAGAGGATALAQAALKSKQSVSASIEMQEKQNEDKRAQGEKQKQDAELSEARRQQGIAMSEGQRMQGLEAAGKQFVFSTREDREMQQLDRTAAMLGASRSAEAQAASDKTSAFGNIAGGFMDVAAGVFGK